MIKIVGMHTLCCASPVPVQILCKHSVHASAAMAKSILFLSLAVLHLIVAENVIYKPIKTGQEVALIMIQGAQVTTDQYAPLMKAIQLTSEYSLWIGVPQYPLDTVEPLVIESGIQRILGQMKSQGMNTSILFFAGHSLGGAMLQDYVHSNPNGIKGQILMGSYLERKYKDQSYPIPTATMGGELDGLTRVTRLMESYYHYILNPYPGNEPNLFPVVVIPGMSHMQFASGSPPFLVREKDLKPEISYNEAHSITANLTTAFMRSVLGGETNPNRSKYIQQYIDSTGDFLKPLLLAFEMEGYYHFKPPCYDDPPSPKCTTGCPWSEIVSQRIMGGLPNNNSIQNKDSFHPASEVYPKDYLPKVLNNCSTYSPSCILNTTTVSQCIYEVIDDKLDTGFFPTSASEIITKLSSRQKIMEAAGMGKVDFNKTDGGSICKKINEYTYSWALANAGSNTLARFKKLGEPMVFGEDKLENNGLVWIYYPLEYNQTTNNGKTVLKITSLTLRTPTEFIIPIAGGFHFCKVLSPARAMEWIYVDGLRLHDSINNYTFFK